MIAIACIRSEHSDWSHYFRLELLASHLWRWKDGTMPLWQARADHGGWVYTKQGNLALYLDDDSAGIVLLQRLHWNWEAMSKNAEAALTGKGLRRRSTGEIAAKLVWVLGDQVLARYVFPPDEIKGHRPAPGPGGAPVPDSPHIQGTAGELFSIRCLGGGKLGFTAPPNLGGGSAAPEALVFEITDLQNGRVARYWFAGVELGLGASIPMPGSSIPNLRGPGGVSESITIMGPVGKPTQFSTTRPQRLEDFSGTGTLMSSGIRLGQITSKSATGLGFESKRLSALPGCSTTVVRGEDDTDIVSVDVPSLSTGGLRLNLFSAAKGPFRLIDVTKKP